MSKPSLTRRLTDKLTGNKKDEEEAEWTQASDNLGIFKKAKAQYKEVKKILDKDHSGKDYDLWWAKDGKTMLSIGAPVTVPKEGQSLGGVNFKRGHDGSVDVKDDAMWAALKSYATKHTESNDWADTFGGPSR